MCDKFFVLTMSLYALISLLYKQLLQYTLLKTFTVPSALLTKFAYKFHTKLLASAFISQNGPRKHCFDAAVFHLSIKRYCKTRPHRSYCFLSMLKIHCKRHYRNLATYRWCTTWREHVTKNGAGATPIFGRRRRRQRTALLRGWPSSLRIACMRCSVQNVLCQRMMSAPFEVCHSFSPALSSTTDNIS